jgi:hypothetical protein
MLSFFIIDYVYSSTKLEKGQNRFCLETKRWEREGGSGEQGGEMVQTMYAHMNK